MFSKELIEKRIKEATQEYIAELERMGVCPVINDEDIVLWLDVQEEELDRRQEMYDNAYHELTITAGAISLLNDDEEA